MRAASAVLFETEPASTPGAGSWRTWISIGSVRRGEEHELPRCLEVIRRAIHRAQVRIAVAARALLAAARWPVPAGTAGRLLGDGDDDGIVRPDRTPASIDLLEMRWPAPPAGAWNATTNGSQHLRVRHALARPAGSRVDRCNRPRRRSVVT